LAGEPCPQDKFYSRLLLMIKKKSGLIFIILKAINCKSKLDSIEDIILITCKFKFNFILQIDHFTNNDKFVFKVVQVVKCFPGKKNQLSFDQKALKIDLDQQNSTFSLGA